MSTLRSCVSIDSGTVPSITCDCFRVAGVFMRRRYLDLCVCLRIREQCLRSEITSVVRVEIVLPQPFYIQPADSSSMTLFVPKWRGTIQTNIMIPSMTRYAAATRSRRCPRESEHLPCLKFESKQRVIFPLATVAMAYWEHAEYTGVSCYYKCGLSALTGKLCHRFYIFSR